MTPRDAAAPRAPGAGAGGVGLVILAGLWVATCVRVLLLPPGHDFLGDMYWTDLLSPHVWSGRLPAWNHGLAMGHPLVVQRMNLMLFLPTILLKALVADTELAARLYLVIGHSLSGAAFYFLARQYVEKRLVAAFASLLFLVAPLHVAELTVYGHWGLAQSFALSPLVLALVVRTVRARGAGAARSVFVLGAAAAWLAWADNERTATLLPLVAVFAGYEVFAQGRGARLAATLRLGAAGLVAAALAAGFLVPGAVDHRFLALSSTFNPNEPPFELWHPALLLDRLWSLGRLPAFAGTMHPIAHVHVGWVSAVLAAGALIAARREPPERRRLVLVLALASGFVVLLSMGSNSVGASTYDLARAVGGPVAGAAVLVTLAAAFVAFSAWAFRRFGIPGGAAAALLAGYALVGRPWLVLSLVPPYGSMRSVLWFLTINLPILLGLLAGIFLDHLRAGGKRAVLSHAAIALLAALDLSGYLLLRAGFSPSTRDLYQSLGRILGADADSFRIAWTPFVPSDPLEAYADRLLGQRDAGSWVLWCSTKWAAPAVTLCDTYVQEARRLLRRGGSAADAATERALRHYAACDVKYLLITRGRRSYASMFGRGLTPVLEAGTLLVARNDYWAPGGGSGPKIRALDVRRLDGDSIVATFEGSGELVLSESYHPYWRGELNGHPVEVVRARDHFLGIHAPSEGRHRLVLRYRTPWYYRTPAALSFLTFLVLPVAWFRSRPRHRRRSE